MRTCIGPVTVAVLITFVAGACDDGVQTDPANSGVGDVAADAPIGSGPVIDPGDGGDYRVEIDPARFTSVVDHPMMPKVPGTRWVYEAESSDGELETITVEVLDETRVVMGLEVVVVRDVVESGDGEVVEDTDDWFAQDDEGNVWYFGEATTSYEDGMSSADGSWEAGVDGALPGIVMPADPAPSEIGFRQEYLAGEAEDMGQVIDVASGVVVTRDWTPLEADVVEVKTYVEGVGLVHETKVAGDGGDERVRLVDFTAG